MLNSTFAKCTCAEVWHCVDCSVFPFMSENVLCILNVQWIHTTIYHLFEFDFQCVRFKECISISKWTFFPFKFFENDMCIIQHAHLKAIGDILRMGSSV